MEKECGFDISLQIMHAKFRNGWVPQTDPQWVNFKRKWAV
jgi:hypothetical protein